MNPYLDVQDRRVFFVDKPDEEFVWHRDNETREIEILEGDGWQFQWEGALPWLLKPGMKFTIKENEYHRIIKGVNNLIIKITPKDK